VTLEKAAEKPPAPPASPPPQRPRVIGPSGPASGPERKVVRPASEKPVEKSPSGSPIETAVDRPPEPPGSAEADGKPRGILVLGSKPPCEIFIDGSATGLHTPQTEIKLSPGRHKVTLVNSEFGIKESFNVDIKLDAPEKMIKDYSDRLPNP